MNSGEELLSQLRDIHLPAGPSIWPLAPGWWVLLALVVAVGCWYYLGRAARSRKRLRLQVWSMLQQAEQAYEKSGDARTFLAQVSVLIRRVALVGKPRSEVASLTGVAWLRYLDGDRDDGEFVNGAGQVLLAAPYQQSPELDLDQFVGLVKRWLREHL